MDWGWEQWFVAVFFAVQIWIVCINMKGREDKNRKVVWVAFNVILGFNVMSVVALVSGGFF